MVVRSRPSDVENLNTASSVAVAESTSRPDAATKLVTAITPPRGWQLINSRELWQYRELAVILAWRDLKVRYKQTLLGIAWAVLQPAMMMVVFTIVFDRMARVPTGDVPYPLFSYAGLLPWTFFATAVGTAGNSVVGSERLISKIYFPRLIVPFAAVGAAAVDFVVAFGLLLAMMLYYGVAPGVGMLLVPLIFLPIALTALGVGTLLAALNVSYRDFRYVIPFLLQLWMFATPSIYMATPAAPVVVAVENPTAAIEQKTEGGAARATTVPGERDGLGLRSLLALNPIIVLISAFRAAALGGGVPWVGLAIASTASFVALLVGCLYFRLVEDNLADVI